MTKENALKIVLENAKLYQKNLENKNLLIFYQDKNSVIHKLEITFLARNFLHFTGLKLNTNIKSSKHFYTLCLNNKISLSDFEFSSKGTTPLKLQILHQVMQISKTAKMIGDYDNSKILLCTDKIIGNNSVCIGMIKQKNSYYIPNTVLKENIKTITSVQYKIIGIFEKHIRENKYVKQTYRNKRITKEEVNMITKLLAKYEKK